MTKILVTTDFSINSKSAIYFAIQLAKQTPVSITFFHSYHILRPTSFSEAKFEAYEKSQTDKIELQLKDFIADLTKDSGISPDKFDSVIRESVVPDGNILNYAENGGFDYICMGTRGAGTIEKIFGTNTSHIINKSEIPVIAVPKDYESKPITHLLYASDLFSLENEINKVVSLAKPIQAKVEVLNFSFPSEMEENKSAKEKIEQLTDYPIDFHLQENDFQNTLVENIAKAVEKSHPSLLVMFTNQKKSIFEKLLFSSNSEDVAFNTKVPLLIFKKDS